MLHHPGDVEFSDGYFKRRPFGSAPIPICGIRNAVSVNHRTSCFGTNSNSSRSSRSSACRGVSPSSTRPPNNDQSSSNPPPGEIVTQLHEIAAVVGYQQARHGTQLPRDGAEHASETSWWVSSAIIPCFRPRASDEGQVLGRQAVRHLQVDQPLCMGVKDLVDLVLQAQRPAHLLGVERHGEAR